MKVAIFHNYLDNIGGAERVGLTLANDLKADIYTTNINEDNISKMGFGHLLPRIYSIGKIPRNAPFKQQIALYKFRKLNLKNKYDFYIIDGDWAMAGAVNNKPNLWYVHSPIREIWDLYEYTRENIVPWYQRPLFDVWVFYNRYLNKKYIKEVNTLVCNSNNTKNRIKKFLGKDAVVINPPIETSQFKCEKYGNYWLSVNRLLKPKRIEMQMEAFSLLPKEKLIIVGSYEKAPHFLKYADFCKKIKPENVEIKSWVSQQDLINLYANCKGFLTTSYDEDFGMNVLEAMASGKPVIAPNEGGYKETVTSQTGILIDNINAKKIAQSISQINTDPTKYKIDCINQAKKFDTKIFIQKIKDKIVA